MIADIEKAFLQLEVNPLHRGFLRFFNPNGLEYRHRRVVFGVTSSPFLLGAVINYHLDKMKISNYDTVKILERSFYVDNLITSVDTKFELHSLRQEAIDLMNKGRMNLRYWLFNIDWNQKDNNTSSTLVLGIMWDIERDTLACNISRIKLNDQHVFTKREVLAVIQQSFDPIGFICPLMLLPKLLLQTMWIRNLGWDEPLPYVLDKDFKKWVKQLERLEKVEIPRCIGIKGSCQLHVFADASKNAYASCVFVRISNMEKIKVNLIRAKSRLAPKGTLNIPRLELMACIIAARLAKSVIEALSPLDYKIWFWTDSTTVLWWIIHSDHLEKNVFLRNFLQKNC